MSGDDTRNVVALHRWLSLEEWFTRAEAERRLTVAYREYDTEGRDPAEERDGPPMSGGLVELVLVIAGAAASPVFEDLYRQVKVAVRAWRDNTSSEEHPVEAAATADDAPAVAVNTGGAEDTGNAAAPEDDEGGRNP
ncbi:hypothetical protein ABZ901_07775 [Actinacidiphila alni]|uniref:hypothetical protein n=1 Tax=Actinacidiphila alni TaxID=380248 RepID=UPI0033CAAF0C